MSSPVKAPFKDHEVADYERRRYRGLDQRIVHLREVRLLKKALGLVEAGAAPGIRPLALDAPCGYGRFAGLLIGAGYRPLSCDLSLAMVKRARAKDSISPVPIGIVANVPAGLPFRDGVFPLVFSLRFFHHLHRPEERRAALGEFARAGSGCIIVSFYRANALHLAQRALRRRIKRTKTRIKMITKREFEAEAQAAGLQVVRIFPLFRAVHAQQIALLRKI